MNKKNFGNIGEEISCKYLIRKNYKIIERNFYYRGGEIDIIADDAHNNDLVFFEVKTRSGLNYGVPSAAINPCKLKRIMKGIKYYVYKNKQYSRNIRVDALEIYYIKDKIFINHIKQII